LRKIANILIIFMVLLGIPVLTTIVLNQHFKNREQQQLKSGILIEMQGDGEIVTMDLEEYLIGLLPNQISSDCEPEMLKAQAVIARTNVQKQMKEKGSSKHEQLGFTFTGRKQLEQLWGKQKATELRYKMEQAISSTFGQTVQYDEKYIDALYHGISIGETVSAEEYLGTEVPYLISVDSSRDIESPEYLSVKEWDGKEFVDILKEYSIKVTKSMVLTEMNVEEQTEMGYVKTVAIGDRKISGEDFREIFHLNSTNFYFNIVKDKIRITTVGKGHGMGLSQFGGNLLALDGENYQTILGYYYPGTSIVAF
jgi:stage II sporulation protein D